MQYILSKGSTRYLKNKTNFKKLFVWIWKTPCLAFLNKGFMGYKQVVYYKLSDFFTASILALASATQRS